MSVSEQVKKQFADLVTRPYIDQAKWFLNGFWVHGAEAEAENIWKYTNKFIDLDEKKRKEGFELDEFQAHRFLEAFGETMTVVAMRQALKAMDFDSNGRLALLEFLIFKYEKSVHDLVNNPQGGAEVQKEIELAAEKLNSVQTALVEVQKQLAEQQVKLEAQQAAEEEVRKCEAELRAALDELKAQEDAYHGQIAILEAKSQDSNLGVVSRNKASAELAQLKAEDPLPLRRAKITQEAAVRKVEKQRKAAEAVTAQAEAQTRVVEAAVAETEARVKEAEEFLQAVKLKGGVAHGAIWWMERELKEAQKYLPKRKQVAL